MLKCRSYKIWILLLAQLCYVSGTGIWAQSNEPQSRQDWRQWLQKAREAYLSGDYKNALEYYKAASLGVPKEVDLAPELAQTFYRLNANKEAKEWYDRAENNAKIAYNKGNVAFEEKDYDQAIQHYKESLKLDPNFEKARFNLNKTLQLKNQKNPPPPQNQNSPPPPSNPNPNQDEKPYDSNQENESGLSDRSIERLLDQLMKQESQTKRKVSSGKEGGDTQKSNKDW